MCILERVIYRRYELATMYLLCDECARYILSCNKNEIIFTCSHQKLVYGEPEFFLTYSSRFTSCCWESHLEYFNSPFSQSPLSMISVTRFYHKDRSSESKTWRSFDGNLPRVFCIFFTQQTTAFHCYWSAERWSDSHEQAVVLSWIFQNLLPGSLCVVASRFI